MAMFWEFFSFELKFRLKSVSTYVYFRPLVHLSFLSIAAEALSPSVTMKMLLNGPFANSLLSSSASSALLSSQRSSGHRFCATSSAIPTNFSSQSPSPNLLIWADDGLVPSSQLFSPFRSALRRVLARSLRGPTILVSAQASSLVSAAVLSIGRTDLLSWIIVLSRCRALPQDLYRLPTGRAFFMCT